MTNQDDIDNDPARLERGLQQAIARIAESAARPAPPAPRRPIVHREPGFYWVREHGWTNKSGQFQEPITKVMEWRAPDDDDDKAEGEWWTCGWDTSVGEPDEVLSGPLTPPEVKP